MLGSGTYSARFVRRATTINDRYVVGSEIPSTQLSWGRVLNSTSSASATFALGNPDCVDTLSKVEPWRDEMEIYRDPGGLVWVGPVGDVLADPNTSTATVPAKDLSYWWSARGIFEKVVHRRIDLATIFADYLAIAFDVDDPGIHVEASPIGVLGDRTIAAADLKMLDDLLSELTNSGVDWTTAARTFFVGGVEISSAPRLAGRLVDEHFSTAPQTRRTGTGMVTEPRVRGNKFVGRFGGPDELDGVLIQGVDDRSTIADQDSADYAAETWWDRAHEPLVYLEGSNSLAPGAPVDIQDLVAGIVAFVDVEGAGVVPLRQEMRMEQLAVSVSADSGETVTPTFQPLGTQEALGG